MIQCTFGWKVILFRKERKLLTIFYNLLIMIEIAHRNQNVCVRMIMIDFFQKQVSDPAMKMMDNDNSKYSYQIEYLY